jgi:GMP synthase-like glutamine amidotransferase
MSGLGKLKVLHMGQTRVQTLPEDFGKLGSLIELNLQECKSLKSLPDNFGLLSELQKLVMHHNKSFVKLPEGFGRLQALVEHCR